METNSRPTSIYKRTQQLLGLNVKGQKVSIITEIRMSVTDIIRVDKSIHLFADKAQMKFHCKIQWNLSPSNFLFESKS